MKIRLFYIIAILCVLLTPAFISAQEEETQSGVKVEFSLYYDPLSLALESWSETKAPDSVKMEAYKAASGFLAGVPFHFEANRNKITITEQVNEVARDLKYLGTSTVEDCRGFNYAITVPSDRVAKARTYKSYPGHGLGDEESLAPARESARKQALDEAIRAAMSEAYLRQSKPMPGMLDGRITWYEITNEGRDRESGSYFVDLNAWILLPSEPVSNGQS